MLTIILIVALLIVASAALPRRLTLFAVGVNALLIGLLLLDEHTTPAAESSGGVAYIVIGFWVGLSALIYAIRFTREFGSFGPVIAPANAAQALISWPLPVGFLISVLIMHWLSNRLAGASPAWLIHVAVFATAALGGYLVLRKQSLLQMAPTRYLAAVAFCGLALLVFRAAVSAPNWAARARAEAGSRPFCLLTFAGRDHARPARSTLELSPLVSRSGGRSFVNDAGWLVIEENRVRRALTWQQNFGARSRGGFRHSSWIKNPLCRPGLPGQLGS